MDLLDTFRFPTIPQWIASSRISIETLAARLNIPSQEWDEDGLGPASGLLFRGTNAHTFLVYELVHGAELNPDTRLTIEADAEVVMRIGAAALREEALTDLRIHASEITAVPDPDLDTQLRESPAMRSLPHEPGET